MKVMIALRRAAIGLALLVSVPVAACGAVSGARLQVTQTSDATAGTDHKGHLAPGTFAGITVAIRNIGAAPARGLTIQDLLPSGFRYYELTTLGGNAIRTSTQEPGAQGDPQWGTWTIPAASATRESELVLSFNGAMARAYERSQDADWVLREVLTEVLGGTWRVTPEVARYRAKIEGAIE